MKKRIIFFLLFLAAIESSAQHTFSKFYNNDVYGNRIGDQTKDFIQLKDSGFLFPSYSYNLFATDTLGYAKTYLQIIRTDKDGDTIFRRLYFRKHHTLTVTRIQQLNEHHFLLLGHTFDLVKLDKDSTGANLIIIKINDNGDTIWTKQASIGDGDELGSDFIRTRDGGFAVFGQVCNKKETNCDYFLMKLDSNGNKLWHQTYSYTSTSWELPMAMQETLNGDFLLVGYNDDAINPYIIKTDSLGNRLWQKRLDSRQGYPLRILCDVTLGNSNTYLVAGIVGIRNNQTGEYKARGYFVRLDTSGNFIFERQFGNPDRYTNAIEIIEKDGVIYTLGETDEYLPLNSNNYNTSLNAFDATTGTTFWRRIYADSLLENSRYLIYKMRPTLDNGFAMIGWGKNPKDTIFQNSQDVWLLKVDSNGCLYDPCIDMNVGVGETKTSKKFTCYPNPAHREINIESDEDFQSIFIYNMIGQEVIRFENPVKLNFNVEDLPKGVYLLKAITKLGEEFTERILVN